MGGGGHAACDLKSCNRTLALVSFFAAVGGFLFGYDLALIGGALLYIEDDLNIDESEIEIVVAGTKIGAVFGTFVGGWMMQRFGRRIALTALTTFFIVGPVVMAVAENSAVLALGRVLTGLGVGASAVVCPAYTAEMAPPSLRGAMVSMYEIMLCAGMFVAVIMDYALAGLPLGVNWRWMVGMPAIFALVQLMAPCLLPESPYWLVSKDKMEEGLKVLHLIHTAHGAGDEDRKEVEKRAETELLEVRQSFLKSRNDDAQMWYEQSRRCCNGCACLRSCECLRNLFRRLAAVSVELWQGVERRATRLVMIMALIDQLCASTAIINYAPTVILSLQNVGALNYNGTNFTSGMCLPCGGTRDAPTGACGQWSYGEDPWVPVKWSSSAAGATSAQVRTVTGYSLDSSSGVSLFTSQQSANEGPYNAFGRAIVLHDSNGVRVSCGCCAGSGDETTGLAEVTMGRYPGYTGGLDVSGSVVVEDLGGKVQLTYDLSGLEISTEGGLHIHTGTSCTDSAAVGGHLYATSAAEDPDQVLQVCNAVQGLCVPAGLPDCVCASGQQDNFCNASLAPDPWTDCHFCNNATAPLDDAAEAVGESAAIAAAKLVGMVVAIVLIDSKYGGRRPLLIFGSYGMGIAMIMLTTAVALESLAFALVAMAIFILAFSASWAGGFWVVVSELFSMRTKAIAAPIATAVLFAAGALANITFLSAYNGMGASCFLIYAIISFAGGMYLQVYLPETKGKTLAEVQAIMQDPENNTHGHFGYVCGCWPCCPVFRPKGKRGPGKSNTTSYAMVDVEDVTPRIAEAVEAGDGFAAESDSDSDNVYEDAETAARVAREKKDAKKLDKKSNHTVADIEVVASVVKSRSDEGSDENSDDNSNDGRVAMDVVASVEVQQEDSGSESVDEAVSGDEELSGHEEGPIERLHSSSSEHEDDE